MAKGKEAIASAGRKLAAANAEIEALRKELGEERAGRRADALSHADQLQHSRGEAAAQAAEYVERLTVDKIDKLAEGLTRVTWAATRAAMTEHITWMFLRGLITWDRMDGDEAFLNFILAHGDPAVWFSLCEKHAHMSNYANRRKSLKVPGHLKALSVLAEIADARKRDAGDSRKALDAVVEVARDAFLNVELTDVMTDDGWEVREPTADERSAHEELMQTIRERPLPAVAERAAELSKLS